jgi:hypothetical protein
MPLSVVDLYGKILPRTNCGDCGHPTCLAFASMVVSEKLPLSNCPHLKPELVDRCQSELDQQHAAGKWTKRDMAVDALQWARERAASMAIEDLPPRIGGHLVEKNGVTYLELSYFNCKILIGPDDITRDDQEELTQWEKVFIYNHMAQGGDTEPVGKWKGFQEIPNTVSKIKSMQSQVETPLQQRFSGRVDELAIAARTIGGIDESARIGSADLVFLFQPLPRIPVQLLFWDEDQDDGFEAKAKLIFDDTITDHLDIESIVFLSERIAQLLCSG